MVNNKTVNIIGGGLAGCEAAFQLAKRGINVNLYEQKPIKFSPAHTNSNLAEIVCSNSLKSMDEATASGMLKSELEMLDCELLKIAKECSVPAGTALAVDRDKFAQMVTDKINATENITVISKEVTEINVDETTIIATGPLTSGDLYANIQNLLGEDGMHFYDASSPIIDGETLDKSKVFTAGRYNKGESDYLNCPMNKEEYYNFVEELVNAKKVELKNFEQSEIFEGCMPIEIMASRGKDSLRFGPLKPVGLTCPDGTKPFAVVQLRKESTESSLYNLVGFQTNLIFGEQKRVFSLIPALKHAEFVKYGVMHRNSYICAPKHINNCYQLKKYPNVFFAGQISGVEGYVESITGGLLCAINVAKQLNKKQMITFPGVTMVGALANYVSCANSDNFQPMNANFGILPPLTEKDYKKYLPPELFDGKNINKVAKKDKKLAYTYRGLNALKQIVKHI